MWRLGEDEDDEGDCNWFEEIAGDISFTVIHAGNLVHDGGVVGVLGDGFAKVLDKISGELGHFLELLLEQEVEGTLVGDVLYIHNMSVTEKYNRMGLGLFMTDMVDKTFNGKTRNGQGNLLVLDPFPSMRNNGDPRNCPDGRLKLTEYFRLLNMSQVAELTEVDKRCAREVSANQEWERQEIAAGRNPPARDFRNLPAIDFLRKPFPATEETPYDYKKFLIRGNGMPIPKMRQVRPHLYRWR